MGLVSLLTGITATGGVTGGNISTSGTISAGSTTVSTLTTTGSATVTGTLTVASNTFRADTGSVTVTTRVGIGTTTPRSAYRLQVADDAVLGFVVGSSGSITVKTLAVTGSTTVSGTLTATINPAGKKRISITPTSAVTDESGEATFTITATEKIGNAKVTFKAGAKAVKFTVKVRKK